MNDNALPRIQEALSKANLGAIVLPANPTTDAVAAACSLYLALMKMGKSVALACSQKVNLDISASDKIQQELVATGDNLVISFPYNEGSIDKVDYNISGESFNLVVTPRPGFSKLDPSQVKYSYSGGALDFIIVIDSPTLQSLGTLYTDNQTQFQGKEIINIDRHLTNAFYGTINYVNKSSSSISELVFAMLQQLKIEVDKNMATNLYSGIASATNNFSSYSVNAETFETIAQLLRLGAVKKMARKPATQFSQSFSQPSPTRSFQTTPQRQIQTPKTRESQPVTPIENVEKPAQPEQPAPQDWLKPKIFRGGNDIL